MTDGIASPAPPRFFAAAWLIGAWRAPCWMWSECGCKWTRRALPSRRYAQALGEGRGFALHRGSWMSVPVPMVVFSPFVEVLVAQGVVHVIGHGTQALELHLLLLFGSLWSVVRTVALRSAMHEVDTVGVGAPAPWRTAR